MVPIMGNGSVACFLHLRMIRIIMHILFAGLYLEGLLNELYLLASSH